MDEWVSFDGRKAEHIHPVDARKAIERTGELCQKKKKKNVAHV